MASFPPKCCGKPLRISVWGSMLDSDVLDRYKEIEAEFSANRPLYCASRTCSAFIPDIEYLPDHDEGVCQECLKVTCKRCRKSMDDHNIWDADMRVCPADDADVTALYALGSEKKWKQCPTCLNMVERIEGCNHMDCICGVEFCYRCGKLFDEEDACDCDPNSWDEEEEVDEDEDEDEENEDDDEEWPNFRVAVDALGRPTCRHWNTDTISGGEDICHGCLKVSPGVRGCSDCGVELCGDCLEEVQNGTRDTDEDTDTDSDDEDEDGNDEDVEEWGDESD